MIAEHTGVRDQPDVGGAVSRAALDVGSGASRAVVGTFATGSAARVLHRQVQAPADLQSADPEPAARGDNGGTAQLFQQLVFRPVPGLGRVETVIEGLNLSSASAHPGGGVQGV